jgi:hypothetical protein
MKVTMFNQAARRASYKAQLAVGAFDLTLTSAGR